MGRSRARRERDRKEQAARKIIAAEAIKKAKEKKKET